MTSTNLATPMNVGLHDLDLFQQGVPHETFAKLRADAPVSFHHDPASPGFWSVHRYDDVVAVNRDNTTFSSNNTFKDSFERESSIVRSSTRLSNSALAVWRISSARLRSMIVLRRRNRSAPIATRS